LLGSNWLVRADVIVRLLITFNYHGMVSLHILRGDVPAVTDGRDPTGRWCGKNLHFVGTTLSSRVEGWRSNSSHCIKSYGSCAVIAKLLSLHIVSAEGETSQGSPVWVLAHLGGTQI
jgi:hypothetical protein